MGNTSFSLLLLLLEQGKTKPKLENDESVESLLWRRARTVLKKENPNNLYSFQEECWRDCDVILDQA